ncbi:MAG: energy-coupled thiamine transporter ThiT [Lachnospiraceae bacterium]|jgi:thiamine transporter|nr:energy-coupled thiamine transporter ThiT [Lachnospiraceae bacterium]
MSIFFVYDAENAEYLLQPGSYAVMAVLLLLLLLSIRGRRGHKSQKKHKMKTQEMVFCAAAIGLATVTSFLKFVSLPFGGSVTLFSMLFISLIGYFYGAKTGLTAGLAYGILQLLLEPHFYAPLQVILDYPLAFGALGLSGFFNNQKKGLATGYVAGVAGRYLCHVISGYVFFAEYAPPEMNPLIYTLGYNLTYLLPEMVATVIVISIPAVRQAAARVRRQALGNIF